MKFQPIYRNFKVFQVNSVESDKTQIARRCSVFVNCLQRSLTGSLAFTDSIYIFAYKLIQKSHHVEQSDTTKY